MDLQEFKKEHKDIIQLVEKIYSTTSSIGQRMVEEILRDENVSDDSLDTFLQTYYDPTDILYFDCLELIIRLKDLDMESRLTIIDIGSGFNEEEDDEYFV